MIKKEYFTPQVESFPVEIEANIMSYPGGVPDYDLVDPGTVTWDD